MKLILAIALAFATTSAMAQQYTITRPLPDGPAHVYGPNGGQGTIYSPFGRQGPTTFEYHEPQQQQSRVPQIPTMQPGNPCAINRSMCGGP